MDAQFSLLVNDVALSFSARKVNIHDMKKYLRYLPVFREHTHASNRVPGFLYLIRKDLTSCDTIPELFKCLSIYWSWFNYILFEKLVKKFSNWGDKDFSALGNYKLKLNKFLKRKVSEMPTHTHCTNEIFGFKQHIITCSGEIANQEANHIIMIRDRLATSLGIETYSLILTEIKDGGVELVFLVPAQEAAKDITRELHSEPSDFHRYQPAIPVLDQPTIPVLDLDQPTIPVLEQSTVPLDQPTIPVLDLDRPTIPVLEQSTVSMLCTLLNMIHTYIAAIYMAFNFKNFWY